MVVCYETLDFIYTFCFICLILTPVQQGKRGLSVISLLQDVVKIQVPYSISVGVQSRGLFVIAGQG